MTTLNADPPAARQEKFRNIPGFCHERPPAPPNDEAPQAGTREASKVDEKATVVELESTPPAGERKPLGEVLPAALTQLPTFLVWKFEQKPGERKPRKVPYYTNGKRRSGTQGASADRAQLATFDEAVAACRRGGYAGIGLAMLPENGIVALDFDGCVDERGVVDPRVLELASGTYSELSPSKRGVRAFCEGTAEDRKSPAGERWPFGYETFHAKGFVTITGDTLSTDEPMAPHLAELPAHVREYSAARFEEKTSSKSTNAPPAKPRSDLEAAMAENLPDETVREVASALAYSNADDRSEWIANIQRAKRHPQLFKIVRAWSSQSDLHTDEEFERKWREPGGDRTSYAAILAEAQRRGWVNPRSRVAQAVRATLDAPAAEIMTATELRDRKFPAVAWCVEGLLLTGLFVLAAAPKIGKSWLALQLACAIVRGGRVLGRRTKSGRVLFLGLEDNQRRLQERVAKQGGLSEAEGALLHFANEWPRSDQGGIEQLDEWLTAHPDTVLVVIDVLERFRPPRDRKVDPYQQDYATIRAIKGVADRHRVTVLVVHHTRKSATDDPLEQVSGTMGMTGAADGVLVLKRARGESRAELHVIGRDVADDGEFAVRFEKSTCTWEMLGRAAEVARTGVQEELLRALPEADGEGAAGLTPTELAARTGRKRPATQNALARMVTEGLVSAAGGRYSRVRRVSEAFIDLSVEGKEQGL